ncbi:MAG: SGNH/GDSL hydrolase family protein [Planctomycetota bacterium]|nr:SGNH/GDSL hydrolase family protein [Planctomycetota bacterium]
MNAVTLFAAVLALVGAAPKDTPTKFQLKPGQQIVAIGDSITQAGGYLKMIDAVLAENTPKGQLPPIINVGISGQKAEDLVARFANDVVAKKPAYVTLSIGINDVWHRLGAPHDPNILAAYKANVEKMVDMAQAAKIKVILLAPTIITEDVKAAGNTRLKLYVQAMKDIAEAKKCQFVDLHQMFLTALEKKPAGESDKWITSDGVHMNDKGDAVMAIGVLRALGVSEKRIAASHWPPVKK